MVLVRQMYISSLLQQDRGFKYRSMSQRFYKMLAVGVLASSCGLEKYKSILNKLWAVSRRWPLAH